MFRLFRGSIKATTMVRNSDQIQENFSKFDVIGMARKCIWNICYIRFDERKIIGNTCKLSFTTIPHGSICLCFDMAMGIKLELVFITNFQASE